MSSKMSVTTGKRSFGLSQTLTKWELFSVFILKMGEPLRFNPMEYLQALIFGMKADKRKAFHIEYKKMEIFILHFRKCMNQTQMAC